MQIVWYALIGAVAGVGGGFFGIGGGVIIVPAMILLLGFDQKLAQGTSLVALLAPVGLLGLINYYQEGKANLVAGAWIAVFFFIGAFFGSKIALNVDETLLRRIFSVFLFLVALQMFFKK
ncbi:MAG: sulfite exporter TauE/SafE family protein [Fimbriimonadaceae bacterium]|nr:sulfite exporter TauE/SafE family protein [Chthonomonadaceae bacterium]MCO5298234.1 sulfite exporter TauE/SafE family protein [Fimbriimonadaceae bacterium]